jgi:hypothetical protein
LVTPATELVTAPVSRVQRLAAPLGLAAMTAAATTALHFRDPHQSGSWGYCPFLLVTGHPCPGCGGLRAVNDLTNFDLVGAASSNLLFVVSIPLIVLVWLRWVRRAWDGSAQPGKPEGVTTRTIWIWTGLVLGFWILRNLPFAAWLAP